MDKIMGDFLKRELGSLAMLFMGMLATLLVICCLGDLALKWVGLAAAVAAAAVLRLFLTATGDFKARWWELERGQQEKIALEYEGRHETLPVYQGELHILSDCLVWRSRRRLVMVLGKDIERVKVVQLDKVCDLTFTMKENRKYKLEFLGSQRAGVAQVLSWLRGLSRGIDDKLEIEGGA